MADSCGGGEAARSDAELIAASLHRPEVFASLFDRHAPAVHRYLARRIGDDADDLLAETFLVALEKRARYDLGVADARPWLLGIATNLVRRRSRDEERLYRALRRATAQAGDSPCHADRVSERVDADESYRRLGAALADLAPGDRDVLLLYAWAGLTYEEIAHALDVPVGTVRSRLHRCRHRLRLALELGGTLPGPEEE